MRPGCVPQEWRELRKGVRAWFPEEWPFLDVEAFDTREVLREELGELLAYLRYPDLDIGLVRGGDRRVTRWISQWAYDAKGDDGVAVFAGIRYLSRLDDDWECLAVFDDVEIEVRREISIERDDDDLRPIARRYGLNVF